MYLKMVMVCFQFQFLQPQLILEDLKDKNMMKRLLFLLLSIAFALSCSKKEQISSLYKSYESEIMQGNTIKAEKYLDEVIRIDGSNPKYLKLKIPLLVNHCKKTEAIKLIDEILKTDEQNIELNILKILLLSNGTQKQTLIKKIDLLLEQKMEVKSVQRNETILNLILIKKLQGKDVSDITNIFKKFDLTEDEESLFSEYINLSQEEISSMISQCE